MHDFLLAKNGIPLPSSHGLRASIERHKARLTSEFTRARIRRKIPSLDDFKAYVEDAAAADNVHPRWVRVNALRTTLDEQLKSTFAGYQKVDSVQDVVQAGTKKCIHIDVHVPDLVAVSPRADLTKSEAYKSGAIILQDKASCFPAYLLNPSVEDGDVIDACAAPGNKTTHIAAILRSRRADATVSTMHAFEKDENRAKTLVRMVKIAGSDGFTRINAGMDFLKADPDDELYRNAGALLLDPSCSGSGIVGRDEMPELHLPVLPGSNGAAKSQVTKPDGKQGRKRKREDDAEDLAKSMMVDDDGEETVVTSEKDLSARLAALSSFQLTLLLHAFKFPAARRITYSTCSIHAEENERVVLKALQSDIARRRGWKILLRESQVSGMKSWPVRGSVDAAAGDKSVADACIRAYKDDGHGVMGFFVAGFVRTGDDGHVNREMTSSKDDNDSSSSSSGQGQLTASSQEEHKTERSGIDPSSQDDESDWDGFAD